MIQGGRSSSRSKVPTTSKESEISMSQHEFLKTESKEAISKFLTENIIEISVIDDLISEGSYSTAITCIASLLEKQKIQKSKSINLLNGITKALNKEKRLNEMQNYDYRGQMATISSLLLLSGTKDSTIAAISLQKGIEDTTAVAAALLNFITLEKSEFELKHKFQTNAGSLKVDGIKEALSAAVLLKSIFQSTNGRVFIRDPISKDVFTDEDATKLVDTLKIMIALQSVENKNEHLSVEESILLINKGYGDKASSFFEALGKEKKIEIAKLIVDGIEDQQSRKLFAKCFQAGYNSVGGRTPIWLSNMAK